MNLLIDIYAKLPRDGNLHPIFMTISGQVIITKCKEEWQSLMLPGVIILSFASPNRKPLFNAFFLIHPFGITYYIRVFDILHENFYQVKRTHALPDATIQRMNDILYRQYYQHKIPKFINHYIINKIEKINYLPANKETSTHG